MKQRDRKIHRGGWARLFAVWLAGWLIGVLAVPAVAYTPQSVPNPRPATAGHVSDPDDLLSSEHEARINGLLARLEADTGVQVAVVALRHIEVPSDVFDFAQQLFTLWGLGHQRRDDGLLVLLVMDQRTVRMHTGYGLEGVLPDLLCARIQQEEMVPHFKVEAYGEGLLAGLVEIDRIVRASGVSPTDTVLPLTAHSQTWRVYRIVVGVVLAGGVFVAAIAMAVTGYFDRRRQRGERVHPVPASVRWSFKGWLAAWVLGPAVILMAFEWVPVRLAVWWCSLALYGYFVSLALVAGRRLVVHARQLNHKKAYRDLALLMRQVRGFWVWMALLLPLPFLFVLPYVWTRARHFRDHPRECPACHQAMHKLTESQEDAHLTRGQQVEESLRSQDHDVWQCGACGVVKLWSYPNRDTAYEKCPACAAIALELVSDEVLLAATRSDAGKGERRHACKACGHTRTASYRIPRLPPPGGSGSGSGSSSGGGGSSGSWGGGSSGGGGASTRW